MLLFQCQPGIGRYHVGVIVGMCCVTTYITMMDSLASSLRKAVRIVAYSGLILAALVPLAQALAGGKHLCAVRQSVHAVVGQITLCMLGGLMYALHFPEAFIPGRFDRWGHSHQLFHVFVVLAFVMQHVNSCLMWMWRSTHGACPTPFDTCLL